MKTERRHELQTNVLANSMARWIELAKPYSKAGMAVLIAIVVLLFAWVWTSTQNTRQAADGWNEYFDATSGLNPDSRELLRDISARFSGTMVGQWARLTLADNQLADGTNRLIEDRSLANDELREATEKFKGLLLEATHPTIRQRATYGLARAHEAMGDLESARKEYRSLASEWPDSPFAAASEARANDLDQRGTKSFYDWLASYEPPPPLANEPGTPGARPSFLDEPDAGGILDSPPINQQGVGPALPTVLGPGGAEPETKEEPETEVEPKAETAPEPQKPQADDSESSPADAEPEPDSPASDEKPAPESSEAEPKPE